MIKEVIVMRKDLKMRKGKMIAQGGHSVDSIWKSRIDPSPQSSPLVQGERRSKRRPTKNTSCAYDPKMRESAMVDRSCDKRET